jgi:hypothetical protein
MSTAPNPAKPSVDCPWTDGGHLASVRSFPSGLDGRTTSTHPVRRGPAASGAMPAR